MKQNDPLFLVVDLFCGAGGTTTGFSRAMINGSPIAKVIACVNHDPIAIESHWANHPEVKHFEEDIRTLDLTDLVDRVHQMRLLYPKAKLILWASLECTNFSKAKGGQPRDADSRTLAESLYSLYNPTTKTYYPGDSYIQLLNPDYVQIENVVEFMSWGPMRIACKKKHKTYSELKFIINKDTKQEEYGWIPESKKNGLDFINWQETVKSFGYANDWKELNSANYGAYTSRNRLFGCFAKPGLPMIWPESTHAKQPVDNGMFGTQQKWKAVKDVLDFKDEGRSIFNRKKPIVDKSLDRIYAGLIKFVAGGKKDFLLKYNSTNQAGKHSPPSIDEPCPTIACQNRLGLVHTSFLSKYYSGRPAGKVIGTDGPAGTICTVDTQSLIQVKPWILNTNFNNVGRSIEEPAPTLVASRRHPYLVNPAYLTKFYGTGSNLNSIEAPAGTIRTKDTFQKIQPVFLENLNANVQSIEQPAGTIMVNDKHSLVNCQPFILNPSHGGHCTGTEVPCVVIVARQDKAPLYLVQFECDENVSVPIYEDDTEAMIRIKEFMALYGLSDIKMRMLKVSELLPIQGFPKNYKLKGNQTDQKKFIGNSVVPHVVTCWIEALGYKLIEMERMAA